MHTPPKFLLRALTLFLSLLGFVAPLRAPFIGSVLATPGDLDPAFGTGGLVTTQFGSGDSYGFAVALQADGKIVVAGRAYNGSDYDLALARYNSDGSLDTSFSGDGEVTTDFGSGDDWGHAVAIQPADGKIVVAGTASYNGSNADFALARYNGDGSLDTSFSGDGKVTTDFGSGIDCIYAVEIQPADGKIVVVGDASNGSNFDFALARYNSDGSLDTSFSGDGKVTTDFGMGDDSGMAVAIQPADSKIVVAGYAYKFSGFHGNFDFALARYNGDGSLDTSFSGDGKVTTDFVNSVDEEGEAVVLQADGKIVVAGYSQDFSDSPFDNDFTLARYNSDGSLDTSFSGDGKVTTDFNGDNDSAYAVALQADGKIVVAGQANNVSDFAYDIDFALALYNSDGSLDTSFSGDGKVTTDFGDWDYGFAVALQPDDGKIIVAGYSGSPYANNGDFALARYEALEIMPTNTPTPTPTDTSIPPTNTPTLTPTLNNIYLPLIIKGQSNTQVVNSVDSFQSLFQWLLARLPNQH